MILHPSSILLFCHAVVLDTDGQYTILAGDWGGDNIGGYDLFTQRANNPSNSTPLTFGETVMGSISTEPSQNAYTFSGSSADQVVVRMSATSGEIDPQFRVFRPNGSLLCENATTGGFVEAIERCVLDTDGQYTILAGDWGGDNIGGYDLFTQRANNPGNGTPLIFGETVMGSISTEPAQNAYTFSGSSADQVAVRMSVTLGDLDPQFRVFRPNGSLLCENASTGTFVEVVERCVLDTDGQYTILAGDWGGDHIGDFALFVQRTNNAANATTITAGATITGSIDLASEQDAFTLSVSSSEQILVRMNVLSGDIDPQFRVFRPNGSLLCDNASSGSTTEKTCFFDTNGDHLILVGDLGGDNVGGYELVLEVP